ncbi:MAG TPA: hypothetical protein ENI23_10645 [bacterium]|nr:hypothetical protein [bacterium]
MQTEWKPFPKQQIALGIETDVFEILFGGARGPGKTDAGIIWLLGNNWNKKNPDDLYIHHPLYRALVLRRNYDDLVDWIDRAGQLYRRYGVKIVGQPAVVKWPSGAIFRLGHLNDRKSYEKYLGHGYHRMLIEELTQIANKTHYIKIQGSCRSTIPALVPQMFNTTNPPGAGHLWVKKRFVDPAPYGEIFTAEDGRKRVYIPGTVEDNPILMKDENYILYLDGLERTDPDLYRAWRHGDWDVVAGQFFKMYRRQVHVTEPFKPRKELTKYGGVDWGRRSPFVFLAGAFENVEYLDNELNEYDFNRMWIYGEMQGTEKKPHEWANLMKKGVNLDEFKTIRADPKMFHRLDDGSRSIAKQFKEMDVQLLEGNNDRIAGWEVVKNWMSIAPDGLPYVLFSENCKYLIETLPGLMYDEEKLGEEDLLKCNIDHAADALRYMLIHVKWIDAHLGTVKRRQPKHLAPKHIGIVDTSGFR